MKKMNKVVGIFYTELDDLYRRVTDFSSYRNVKEGMQDQFCYRKKVQFWRKIE